MGNRRKLQLKIETLLKQYSTQIQRAFLEAVRTRVNSIDLAALASAIEQRDIERAITLAAITQSDLFPLDQAVTNTYTAGGQTVPAAAPTFAAAFGFNGRATRAEAWARSHVGGLVTGIADEQVMMLRETIGAQLAEGIGPRQIAVRIAGPLVNGSRQGGFIGLSRPQLAYLENARRELALLDKAYFTRKLRDKRFDGLVKQAIASGKPLSQSDIDRVASRYRDRLLKHRADTIARTESITALRAGRREGIEQAIESGAVRAESLKRVWNATLDSRTRPDHVRMDGQAVNGIDQPFELPDGSRLLFPGDTSLGASASQTINCRCYDEYVVDWLRG